MKMKGEEGSLLRPVAVIACISMTLFYVPILNAPSLILRLPPPFSFKNFMIRRFICAAISSVVSVIVSALILPWQAVVFPLSLTSLMYAGSLVLKSLLLAPLTEELVFRACMIPILICGGFKIYSAIFLCPIFFSLAHLHHFTEIYSQQNYSLLKASTVVGLRLGYTVIFGSYASCLFIRTGHLVAPFVAHIFCNFMGLPVLFERSRGLVGVAFVAGMGAFLWLLFPVTQPICIITERIIADVGMDIVHGIELRKCFEGSESRN